MNDRFTALAEAAFRAPTPTAYFAAARALDGERDRLRAVRVALLSSFTVAPLLPYLRVHAARHGIDAVPYVGPFNSVQQELLDPESGCANHRPDVVFIQQELADVCSPLASDFLGLDAEAVTASIERIAADLMAAISAFRQRHDAAIVVHTFSPPRTPALGLFDAMAESSESEAVRRLNLLIARAARDVAGVYILDQQRLAGAVGHRDWYDDKWWLLARMPFGFGAFRAIAAEQSSFLRVLFGDRRKCLALDLDNTLWGGVVGERGVAGIDLGHSYPGNAFRRFQEYLLQLHRRGILLAILSKNNGSDVSDVFETHPAMVLKEEHFAAVRINWSPKPANLRELAAELGIGLDSVVFFDDDAVECALMREMLPEVLTIQAPAEAIDYRRAIEETAVFEQVAWTADDRRRGAMYRAKAEATVAAASAGSLSAFLEGLRMTATVRLVDWFALPRVVELIGKTNQFNLTTRRYTAAQLAALMGSDDAAVFYLQLSDRLGDNGIVGVAVMRIEANTAFIDAFLLSCRVIGRTAETALLAHIAEWAQALGLTQLEGEFLPSRKNAPAAEFYARHGFTCVDRRDDAIRWRLNLRENPVQWPSYIQPANLTAV